MSEFATYEDLGRIVAGAIDELESQRKFAGDMGIEMTVPLSDGTEYLITIQRKETAYD